MALLDAGVPLKAEVAGVAMGLILEPNGRFCILTDILGSEDALGDMDFKVAGDAECITAFQMDLKVCLPQSRLCKGPSNSLCSSHKLLLCLALPGDSH